MKFLILSCVVAVVVAELPLLPRFRPARFRFERQELAPTTTDSPTEATTTDAAPYPPSGWKPDQPFTLPNEADTKAPYPAAGWKPAQPFTLPNEPPATSYGAPDTSYGVPDNTYGAPTTDATSTENPEAEKLEGPVEVQKSVGTYYVLLPNGQLQEVKFVTENDVQNMRYTARLQLQNRAPLFVFRP
ncbi:uncharacterized protein LOC134744798 [Cydia strobilella]|uniref:uncharacterized protein LOC134744798 n=1 Tax=Cydia strobilella TaxID=1100964 RepID=UPI0030076859